MFEKIIFNLFAFLLFIIIFLELIRKNDTSYVYLLVLQFVGIAINFIELCFGKSFGLIAKIVMYTLSIFIPAFFIWLEYAKKIAFPELFYLTISKITMLLGKEETSKKYLLQLIDKYPYSYKGHKMLAALYEKTQKYELALEEYENGQFIMAEQTIHSAIKLVNKAEYKELLKEIISGIKEDNKKHVAEEKEVIQTKVDKNNKTKPLSKDKKIKLESCNKEDLLTIDGFDEEKAEKFIQERDNGKIYYDIDKFVSDYSIMPHQMVEIQERLVFPPKPKTKIGRKIDW